MSEDDADSPSDREFHDLVKLLRHYSENELDQFSLWRLNTTYGEVYITISRKPITGTSPGAYDDLDAWIATNGVD